MKKIKDIIKNNSRLVIGLIIGLTLFTSVYAATIYYQGDEVSYDNTNTSLTATTVQGALDQVYNSIHTINFDYNGVTPDLDLTYCSADYRTSITFNCNSLPNLLTFCGLYRGYDEDDNLYHFRGWYDNPNYLQGTKYYDKNEIPVRRYDKSTDTTLYAGWGVPLQVSISLNGGKASSYGSGLGVYYGEPLDDWYYENLSRSGYEFMGLYDNADYTQGKQYYDANGHPVVSIWDKTTGTTLYAGWKKLVELPVGDYFIMQPDAATATTSYAGFSGSVSTSEQTLWQVIDNKANGEVDAIAAYVSNSTIGMVGPNAYKNYVAGLQDIASKYAKSGYTVATRMPGYDGQTAVLSSTSAFDGSSTTPPSGCSTTPKPTSGVGQEYNGGICGDTLYLKDYALIINACGRIQGTTAAGGGSNYAFASRHYQYNSSTDFRFGYTYGDSSYWSNNMYGSGSMRYYYNSAWRNTTTNVRIRPIITLRAGIKTTGGSGSKNDPFTISNQ